MPDNLSNNRNNIELKLLGLYKEHNIMSEKIIELLEYILLAITEGDSVKLESYSLIEKEFIKRLLITKRVLKSFEKNCSVFSIELDKYRSLSFAHEKIIISLGKNNRKTLKNSLEKISMQIENISKKVFYSPSFTKYSIPQFVDLNI